jgi:hypothetical protein
MVRARPHPQGEARSHLLAIGLLKDILRLGLAGARAPRGPLRAPATRRLTCRNKALLRGTLKALLPGGPGPWREGGGLSLPSREADAGSPGLKRSHPVSLFLNVVGRRVAGTELGQPSAARPAPIRPLPSPAAQNTKKVISAEPYMSLNFLASARISRFHRLPSMYSSLRAASSMRAVRSWRALKDLLKTVAGSSGPPPAARRAR